MTPRLKGLAMTALAVVVIATTVVFILTSGGRGVHHTARAAPPTVSTLATTNGVLTTSNSEVCTAADLAAVRPYTMPTPQRLVSPVTVDSTPLLPAPDGGVLLVSAKQAWDILSPSFAGGGTVQLILAIDNSDMPATLGPGDSLDHVAKGTLVWVVHTHREPVPYGDWPQPPPPLGSTPSTTEPHPPCVFYDNVDVVSANTGQQLGGEALGTYD